MQRTDYTRTQQAFFLACPVGLIILSNALSHGKTFKRSRGHFSDSVQHAILTVGIPKALAVYSIVLSLDSVYWLRGRF